MPKENDRHFLKVRLKASYIVALPDRDKSDELMAGYPHIISRGGLYDVSKMIRRIVKMTESQGFGEMPRFEEMMPDGMLKKASIESAEQQASDLKGQEPP